MKTHSIPILAAALSSHGSSRLASERHGQVRCGSPGGSEAIAATSVKAKLIDKLAPTPFTSRFLSPARRHAHREVAKSPNQEISKQVALSVEGSRRSITR